MSIESEEQLELRESLCRLSPAVKTFIASVPDGAGFIDKFWGCGLLGLDFADVRDTSKGAKEYVFLTLDAKSLSKRLTKSSEHPRIIGIIEGGKNFTLDENNAIIERICEIYDSGASCFQAFIRKDMKDSDITATILLLG